MARVALILGAGPNLGQSIAAKFAANGYRVAVAARRVSDGVSNGTGFFGMKANLSNPETVRQVFQTTTKELGPPNVVVYNERFTTPPDDPLSATVVQIEASRKAGVDSAFVAAQEALKAFKTHPPGTPTAFIYTGNTLNQIAIPGVLPFALAKVAAAMLIEYCANAYGKDGYRFYYADQRQSNGLPAGADRDGIAHAEMYFELAHESKQSKWLVTFVKGEGRRRFEGVAFDGETRASYDRKFGRE
ncbi:hypothetical protein LTR97_002420 [Elasticomyces elasticus]|uniref:Uncharacterized protein n=1 Tax=Elasticomyces elasticus TaxID=574655 RepID=A0AAN7WH34_9PEZI|nr:hypothetical protein LTR97_002420 [Elasticomyces elasticus]KAK5714571.1 hypothetical protein LTR15_010753 [Elasticomyces elasticus]